MRVTVCGEGYTGLVISACLCEFGHTVCGYDSNSKLIDSFLSGVGIQNLAEPWINIAIQTYVSSGLLSFSNDIDDALTDTDVIIITIPVKGKPDEDINLDPLSKVINSIAPHLSRTHYIPIFLKTSVPVGTSAILQKNLESLRGDLTSGKHYDFITNPTFLREGFGMSDFINPDRVIFGLKERSELASNIIDKLFLPIKERNVPFIFTNFETAELIKSVSMSFTTIKMAFVNEIDQLCKNTSVDIDNFIKGLASDRRISSDSLIFNAGVGGSSLPRTARLLINSARQFGADLSILSSALESNSKRIQRIYDKIIEYCKETRMIKKIAIFGLSFKAMTDDFREAPSLFVISNLLNFGISVNLYDPYYSTKNFDKIPDNFKKNEHFKVFDTGYEAVSQCEALVIMTNWPEFTNLDMAKILDLMSKDQKPLLFDCLNMYPKQDQAFTYIAA